MPTTTHTNQHVQGDEVLFLPTIVEAAESSPAAAAECAQVIRKYMKKDYYGRPAWQYNSLMLLRILTQNPGQTFTRNLDQKFSDTAKDLLRYGKDNNVRQMLMETLEEFEVLRGHDEHLGLLIQMWAHEKTKITKQYGVSGGGDLWGARRFVNRRTSQGIPLPASRPFVPMSPPTSMAQGPRDPSYFSRNHRNNRLPDPVELASRLEEARTSAKLLEQVVMNTPTIETLDNDLIKEFADRCLSASRSIQGYMVASNPSPDNDTMEALIDTNEQLQTALNQHQRSVLSARKQLGLNVRSDDSAAASEINVSGALQSGDAATDSDEKALPLPPRNGKGKHMGGAYEQDEAQASGSGTATPRHGKGKQMDDPEEEHQNPFADPFADHHAEDAHETNANGVGSSAGLGSFAFEGHAAEPFNPGFTAATGSSSKA